MESKTKMQSHCWWFESYNTSNSSPWLQSTLSELNEKTKTMLKLIEADADSFAQRAEMYYKKRPELISMVEDFYRAHRSLAERFDQLKSDRAVRIRSPLSQSLSLPKEGFDSVFDLVSSKSFDSFTEGAYGSEEAAESEVDDPEVEDDVGQVDEDEVEKEKLFPGGVDYDELMKLRDELGQMREENETLKDIIRQKDEEKEEFVKRLSENINEIREFREEMGVVQEDNLVVEEKETSDEVSVPSDEVTKLRDEIERLEMENLYQKEQAKEKAREVVVVTRKYEEVKFGLMKVERELETINRHFSNVIAVKEEEILDVTKQFEAMKSELAKLRLEMRRENDKCEDKEVASGQMKEISVVREVENCEPFTEILINSPNENNLENKEIKLNNEIAIKDEEINETIRRLRDAVLEKDTEKREAIRRLKDAIIDKDNEKNEMIMQLNNALQEKDEEKREAIRQLSIAMEILREESKRLKKTIVNISPKKKSASEFQIFKGVNLSKLFS